jgi:hypothetical protein
MIDNARGFEQGMWIAHLTIQFREIICIAYL